MPASLSMDKVLPYALESKHGLAADTRPKRKTEKFSIERKAGIAKLPS
jgi:hypothetical protein